MESAARESFWIAIGAGALRLFDITNSASAYSVS